MPVESRDDLVTRDEMLEALANQRRALCAAHDEDRAELKRVREYAAKRIAELEGESAHRLKCWKDVAMKWNGAVTRAVTAERALAEERERHQWRTIDSAPKDGTLIDLWMMSEHRRLANCRWSTADEPSHKGAWFCQQGGRSFNMGADDAFTHWRPHPAPPDATAIRSGKPDGKPPAISTKED